MASSTAPDSRPHAADRVQTTPSSMATPPLTCLSLWHQLLPQGVNSQAGVTATLSYRPRDAKVTAARLALRPEPAELGPTRAHAEGQGRPQGHSAA